ncbi:hypothetical protein RHSIM_Rhsim09G0042500 [Rhododendron simsii]|uniref:Gnk2-homologous domain-containing protein n=1 Tax=Rhododendron simsii TaxID=118357 RepID=A0A834LEN5_RHOSS|nr:hypothetical protein RHSIM_Rhsim09G0042500 [Rhododendron simsii]
MGVFRSLFFLSHIILINLVSFTVSSNERIDYFCNYTSSNTYQTNCDTLLASLSNKTNDYGYSSSSEGVNPDTVHAMALCRADVKLDTCRECIKNATAMLGSCPDGRVPTGWPEYDPDHLEGIVWYDYCMVRYSPKVMEGVLAGDPRVFAWNVQKNATSVEAFKDALSKLLNDLRVQAAEGGTSRKFASDNAPGPDSIPIYAFTQCTPDLSKQDCEDCLQQAIEDIPNCCGFGPVGGRVLKPSCNFRYENASFLGVIPGMEKLEGRNSFKPHRPHENVARRPTMGSVVVMLSSSSITLSVPLEPGFFLPGISSEVPRVNGDSSGVNESTQSVNEVSITELEPH